MATPNYWDNGDTRYYLEAETFAAAGTGTVIEANGALMHTQQFSVASLTNNTLVKLEGTIDNDTPTTTNVWFTIASTTVTANGSYYASATDAIKYVRNTVSSISGTIIFKNMGAH